MAYVVSLLPVLACPVAMGAMLWMMRGTGKQAARPVDQLGLQSRGDMPRTPAAHRMGLCLNWKVVAGLAVIGAGFWIVAPQLARVALPVLMLLACPLSMLFMLRGMGGGQCALASDQSAAEERADPERVAALRAQQAAIARELAELEGRASSAPALQPGSSRATPALQDQR